MRDPKVDRFVSEPPKTPFAPYWEYYIAEVMLDIDCDALSTLILEKEKEIITTYPSDSDGSTGLGPNSLTSRFKYFNVLNWDHPEISKVHRVPVLIGTFAYFATFFLRLNFIRFVNRL